MSNGESFSYIQRALLAASRDPPKSVLMRPLFSASFHLLPSALAASPLTTTSWQAARSLQSSP